MPNGQKKKKKTKWQYRKQEITRKRGKCRMGKKGRNNEENIKINHREEKEKIQNKAQKEEMQNRE